MGNLKRVTIPLVAALVVVAAMSVWQLPQVRAALTGPGQALTAVTVEDQPQAGKPFIGISLANNSSQLKDRLGLSTDQGVVIAKVLQGSPGEKAGLAEKDIITAVDGSDVKTAQEVIKAVQAKKVGDQITLAILRGAGNQNINVTLGAAPEPPKNKKGLLPKDGPGGILGPNPGENLRGAKIELTDKDGKTRSFEIVAGTVQSASSASISIVPNGDTAARTFQVTPDTRAGLRGKVEDLKQGDRVMVVAEGGNALQVLGGGPAMLGPGGRLPAGPGRGMFSPGSLPFHQFAPQSGGQQPAAQKSF
ncbi:MAG: PDZ domain-containing protein [Dehalococcoidia bacterium]|nr:PDZ domain-containing protein [Dehalococcoidia bacterium]